MTMHPSLDIDTVLEKVIEDFKALTIHDSPADLQDHETLCEDCVLQGISTCKFLQDISIPQESTAVCGDYYWGEPGSQYLTYMGMINNGVWASKTSEDTSTVLPTSPDTPAKQDTPVGSGITPAGYKLVKKGVYLLLENIIAAKLKEDCYGCRIKHPSQRQHTCLFEQDAYYFDTNKVELKRRLFTDNLISILGELLKTHKQDVQPATICGIVDSILYELETEVYICYRLREEREQEIISSWEESLAAAAEAFSKR